MSYIVSVKFLPSVIQIWNNTVVSSYLKASLSDVVDFIDEGLGPFESIIRAVNKKFQRSIYRDAIREAERIDKEVITEENVTGEADYVIRYWAKAYSAIYIAETKGGVDIMYVYELINSGHADEALEKVLYD